MNLQLFQASSFLVVDEIFEVMQEVRLDPRIPFNEHGHV